MESVLESAKKVARRHSRSGRGSVSELLTLQWRQERPDLDLQNFLLAIYFMLLGTHAERAFDLMCRRKYATRGRDMLVMMALRRSGRPYAKRPTDLFRALSVTSGAITKQVDRLSKSGFVERLPDPSHGGGFLVRLTRKGLKVVDEAVEHLAGQSVLAPAMAQLTPAEREQGIGFALRMLRLLEESREDTR